MAALLIAATAPWLLSREQAGRALASAASSPLSILASRSPGPRIGGVLYKVKRRLAGKSATRHRSSPVSPRERVLAMIRERPRGPLLIAPLGAPVPQLRPMGFSPNFNPAPDADVFGPAFEVPGFNFGDVPLPSGSGAPPEESPVPPGPAVPEPATWAMMIVGIAVIGKALRDRFASARPA